MSPIQFLRILIDRRLIGLQPSQPVGGKYDAPCPRIPGVVFTLHHAPGFALGDQSRHGLLGHAGALRQLGQPCALRLQMAGDVDMRRAHLRPGSQIGQAQRHRRVARHQIYHPCIEALQSQT